MKILIILLLSGISYSQTNMMELLETKKLNFSKVERMYNTLKDFAQKEDQKSFCEFANKELVSLENIYHDDYKLNRALISDNSDISREYAFKIKDNSRSDLFAFSVYIELCDENRVQPLQRHILSIDRSLTNTNLLKMSHLLFIKAYQGLKNL